jgi:tRNA-2-methylthio-N6-dimethylallyladenosine synthase
MNTADSEIVTAVLLGAGMEASSEDKADVLLINTCAIRENAENKIWERLRHVRANRKDAPIAIGLLGCMAERLKGKLLEGHKPLVDFVAGPDAYRDLPRLLSRVAQGQMAINVQLSLEETYAEIAPVRPASNGVTAFSSIMRGCNNMCSYCVVPFTRGRERSRDMASILAEVRALRDSGYKEVTLLGQNVNSYWDKSAKVVPYSSAGGGYETFKGFANMYKVYIHMYVCVCVYMCVYTIHIHVLYIYI